MKIYLSDHASAEPDIMDRNGDYYDFTVTRVEFEQSTKHLVDELVEMAGQMLEEHPEVSMILLTGGASQMPMIRSALEKAVPKYKDKIIFHRPSRAISYGVARYGAHEESVQQRTIWDLGIWLLKNNKPFISILIPADTAIPYTNLVVGGFLEGESSAVSAVYEAKVKNPDACSIGRDFRYIIATNLDCGGRVLTNRKIDNILSIDKFNILTVTARSKEYPDIQSSNQICYKSLQ